MLNRTLQRGEAQYNERLEDIRLLKFEVKRLRTEKALLVKNIANVSDLRQEVFHLNRDLARERLKVTALEEEIQTPLNIHRWRKLEVNLFSFDTIDYFNSFRDQLDVCVPFTFPLTILSHSEFNRINALRVLFFKKREI